MSVTAGMVSAPDQARDEFAPGVYVTDGTRLFRVISPGRSLFPSAELEDCQTLEVDRYFSDELYAMRLHRVRAPLRIDSGGGGRLELLGGRPGGPPGPAGRGEDPQPEHDQR